MLWATIKKDTQLLVSDRGTLATLFALPVIFILAFGGMFGGEGQDEPRVVAVQHPAGSEVGARIAEAIEASEGFALRRVDAPDEVRRLVADEEIAVGLIVPEDFAPGRVPVELAIDQGASIQFRGPIEGALRGLVGAAVSGDSREGPALVESRSPPGVGEPLDDVTGFQVSVPGNAVLFGFFIALTVGLSFVEERRTGTWRRLLAAPVSRPLLLASKLVPYFLIGLVQMASLFAVGILVFGLRVPGSNVALVLLTGAVAFCATALGLLIAAIGGNEKQVGGVGSVSILVMGLVGGAMVPRLIMPEPMQQIGLATPHAWALDGYYDLLIREGTTVADVAAPIAAVFGFGVAFAIAGMLLFRFERA